MSSSFKRIDYSIRPAKHAERKMLCDIFRRLWPFARIEDYVYVGFGSIWFADFILMHRALGIKDMISIEHAESARQRIEDNKPFRIPVDYRPSSDALPDLDWNRKQFIWLDYDDPLAAYMLLDMRTVTRRAVSGTVISVSVQCSKAPQLAEADQDSDHSGPTGLERFITVFGRDRVPQKTTTEDLYGWSFGTLSRTLLMQELEAELGSRNSSNQGPEMRFQPICEFEYEDGAKMTTIVGIFYSIDDEEKFKQCGFENLDFIPNIQKPVRIVVPKLTAREFKRLESQLPLQNGAEINLGSIPQAEARKFVEMYRYFPNFAVLES